MRLNADMCLKCACFGTQEIMKYLSIHARIFFLCDILILVKCVRELYVIITAI